MMTEHETLLKLVADARKVAHKLRGHPEHTRAIDNLLDRLVELHQYERIHHPNEQTVQLK